MASLGAADAAENVAVMIRVRPLTSAEREGGERRVVKCNAAYNEITLTTGADKTVVAGPAAGATKTFTFDRVFDVDTRQSTLFDTAVAPVVDQVLQGFSCTVFAYGQTGTGKTFTMEGAKDAEGALDVDGDNAGIIVRTVKRVFNHLSTLGGEAIVKCSFLEIYNEVSEGRARGGRPEGAHETCQRAANVTRFCSPHALSYSLPCVSAAP